MSKYTPIKLTQLSANESAAVDAINQNLDSIKEHIDDSLSRSAKSPSQMQADLDMNGKKILNIGTPTADTDIVRLKDVVETKAEIETLVNTAATAVDRALEGVATIDGKVVDAADSAALAAQWATKTDGPVADGEYSSKYYAENIGADVHAVADIAEDVTAVASNATNINSVASNSANINAVASDLSNIDAVASNETNVNTVVTNISDINDCADNMSAIQDAPNQAASAAASAEAAAQSAAISNPPPLLTHVWSDHLLNDTRYLRADTFSWQDGTVYSVAYNHLVDDYTNKIVKQKYIVTANETMLRNYKYDRPSDLHPYAWTYISSGGFYVAFYTDSESPTTSDLAYGHSDSSSPSHAITEVGENTQHTETVGSYTITYYLSSDGHKIVLADQESTVLNIYNESGVAWYYVLDQANTRFKLPRENPVREELLQVIRAKGNGIAVGLTNGTDNAGMVNIATSSIGITAKPDSYGSSVSSDTVSAGTYTLGTIGLTTDSTKSGIISDMTDSTSVYKGKQYLYFYVGNYTQSAIQQTAGLNAELFNAKADVDMSNVVGNMSQASKSYFAGLGMPSDTYDDLTLSASGSTYTAPANGYFVSRMVTTSANGTLDAASSAGFTSIGHHSLASNGVCTMLPVKAGDIMTFSYSGVSLGPAGTYFRFIYAVGEI